jgi:hypothetical protein
MFFVVIDFDEAELMSRMVRSPVVVVEDNLLVGPSSKVLEVHYAMRTKYCGYSPSTSLDERLACATPYSGLCVCLGPNLRDFLNLCRICAFLPKAKNRIYNVFLDMSNLHAPTSQFDPRHALLIDYNKSLSLRPNRFKVKTPWTRQQAMFPATLWNLWCAPSPEAFSSYCAEARENDDLFDDLGRYHAGFFPRSGIHANELALSRFDELVIRQLFLAKGQRHWSTTAQLSEGSTALDAWLSHTGLQFLETRLHAWCDHTQQRIVERWKPPAGFREKSWEFNLTAMGESFLEGMPSFDAAPPLHIGGAVAYERHRPWVNDAGVVTLAQEAALRVFGCG